MFRKLGLMVIVSLCLASVCTAAGYFDFHVYCLLSDGCGTAVASDGGGGIHNYETIIYKPWVSNWLEHADAPIDVIFKGEAVGWQGKVYFYIKISDPSVACFDDTAGSFAVRNPSFTVDDHTEKRWINASVGILGAFDNEMMLFNDLSAYGDPNPLSPPHEVESGGETYYYRGIIHNSPEPLGLGFRDDIYNFELCQVTVIPYDTPEPGMTSAYFKLTSERVYFNNSVQYWVADEHDGEYYPGHGYTPLELPEDAGSYFQPGGIDGVMFMVLNCRWADSNIDGDVNGLDVTPFALAVSDPEDYQDTYHFAAKWNNDLTQDGDVDGEDVDPFAAAVLNGGVEGDYWDTSFNWYKRVKEVEKIATLIPNGILAKLEDPPPIPPTKLAPGTSEYTKAFDALRYYILKRIPESKMTEEQKVFVKTYVEE